MNGWLSILAASALGSLHCVGMCGGLVSFYAAGSGESDVSRAAPHAAYHSMRLVAYVALGAAAGQLGSALDLLGSHVGLGNLGLFLAGLTLAFWGVPLLFSRRSAAPPIALRRQAPRRWLPIRRLEALFVALAHRVRRLPPVWRAGALGLASALLPCGWLYAFVVLAAGTGTAAQGGVLMLAFWVGTVPALLGLGVGIGRLNARLRARLPRLSAALVLAVGVFNVAQRWPMASASEHASSSPPSCHAAR